MTIIQRWANDNLTDSESFKSEIKTTRNTPADGNAKDVEIILETLEMPLINCEVNLILPWSSTCVIANSTGSGRFAITDTKLYIPVVTLLTQYTLCSSCNFINSRSSKISSSIKL